MFGYSRFIEPSLEERAHLWKALAQTHKAEISFPERGSLLEFVRTIATKCQIYCYQFVAQYDGANNEILFSEIYRQDSDFKIFIYHNYPRDMLFESCCNINQTLHIILVKAKKAIWD